MELSLIFLEWLTHLNAQKVQIVLNHHYWLHITLLLPTSNSICCHASLLSSFLGLLCVLVDMFVTPLPNVVKVTGNAKFVARVSVGKAQQQPPLRDPSFL